MDKDHLHNFYIHTSHQPNEHDPLVDSLFHQQLTKSQPLKICKIICNSSCY